MRNKLVKARPNSTTAKALGFFNIHPDRDGDERKASPSSSTRNSVDAAAPLSPRAQQQAQAALTSPPTSPSPTSRARSPPPHSSDNNKAARPPSQQQQQEDPRPSFRATLTPASEATINSAMPRTTAGTTANGVDGKSTPAPAAAAPSPSAAAASSLSPSRMNSTIRTVASFDRLSGEDSSSDGTNATTSRNSALSSSINSTASMSSSESANLTPSNSNSNGGLYKIPSVSRLRPSPSRASIGESNNSDQHSTPGARTLRSFPSMGDIPQRGSSISATGSSYPSAADNPGGPTPNEMSLAAGEAHLSGGWDNSVGKAGLGKTGRVINRLVSDNESLKRDIKIERLRAEEARQQAQLLKDQLDRTTREHESQMLDVNVTKTLLARKERQVEALQQTVELERSRAVSATDREKIWKEELEKVKAECKRQVEEANNQVLLTDGRYNALASHWGGEGEKYRKKTDKMKKEFEELSEKRKEDDEKIRRHEEMIDQMYVEIGDLEKQNKSLWEMFEGYKKEKDESLRGLTEDNVRQAEVLQRTIEEAREARDKLRWALNVKENVKGAQ
ncbi:hypothetical protein QBC40DRAFT_49411 [Triangularia verruculosa]|uniref:SWI5-dependent HO expression protein 3 n=1 Tax=Triangularia verruculosa TaxID=2587418 RepID=A0AAN7B0C6_9PEZI|nr:hypothetical protein QBC40DRAFT_49411 [Triangularia verruculosa]